MDIYKHILFSSKFYTCAFNKFGVALNNLIPSRIHRPILPLSSHYICLPCCFVTLKSDLRCCTNILLPAPFSTSWIKSLKRRSDLSVCSLKGSSTSFIKLLHLYKQVAFFSCGLIYLSEHWTFRIDIASTPISLHLLLHLAISSNIFPDFHPAHVLASFHQNTLCTSASQSHFYNTVHTGSSHHLHTLSLKCSCLKD